MYVELTACAKLVALPYQQSSLVQKLMKPSIFHAFAKGYFSKDLWVYIVDAIIYEF